MDGSREFPERMKMVFLIDGRDICKEYLPLDVRDYQGSFLSCLPSNADGGYSVSNDGTNFFFVSGREIWDYPVVEINTYDGDGDSFKGISQQGVALLVLDMPNNDEELHLDNTPYGISEWNGRRQLIFRLRNYLPRTASEDAREFFFNTIMRIEWATGGSYSDQLINPLCRKVKSYIFNTEGLSLAEIIKIFDEPPEPPVPTSVKLANAQKITAAIRKGKTFDKLLPAVYEISAHGDQPTQKLVAERSGFSLKTVKKRWEELADIVAEDRIELVRRSRKGE